MNEYQSERNSCELKVFIYPNLEKAHSFECTTETKETLFSFACQVIMTDSVDPRLSEGCIVVGSIEEAVKSCDVIITIGGDGTILNIASLAAVNNKKLLGINCGRLGFMASLERSELKNLELLVSGEYKTESRMMLDAVIKRADGGETCISALNDIVITHGFNYYINDFTVIADGVKVSSLRADGLIFSTPTGASAYSLSAGGPLIEPSMDCIEFTQICPHSLFARTMIFSSEKLLEVKYKADGEIGICADGCEPIPVTESDRVYIKKSDLRLDLIDICGNNYFESIGSKLMQPAKDV